VIIKKTFKIKTSGFQAEKNFTLHGAAVTPELVNALNQGLGVVECVDTANRIQFKMSKKNLVHYTAAMNHDFQKNNEEDAMVALLDTMEVLGWNFRFQYDAELWSGSSRTNRELFVFYK